MKRCSILISLLGLMGCSGMKGDRDVSAANGGIAPGTPATTCATDADCAAKQLCVRMQCVDVTSDLAECSTTRVHFTLNSSDMDPTARASLARSARCLKADHALRVTIEGNADERGTEEYNMALGDRRATSVAKALESLGASAAQLKTISYGEENPLCTEHDAECWTRNRRTAVKLK